MQDPNKLGGVPSIPGRATTARPPPTPGTAPKLALALSPSLPASNGAPPIVGTLAMPPMNAQAAPTMDPPPELALNGQSNQLTSIDERWGKLGVTMVAIALLFAGGVAYFIVTNGSDSEASEVIVSEGEGKLEPENDKIANSIVVGADAGLAAALVGNYSVVTTENSIADTDVVAADISGSDALLRANGEIDRPAGLISLTIESEPSGARVVRKRDGIALGVTPFQYEQESVSGVIIFVIEMDGYSSTTLKMPADRDGLRQIVLLPGRATSIVAAPPPPAKNPLKKQNEKKMSTKTLEIKTKVVKRRPASFSQPRKTPKKKPATVKKPKLKSGGKVDYNADPIPFD